MTRKQRRIKREKLNRRIDAMSKNIGRMFVTNLTGKVCCECANPATGIGNGEFFCANHFWEAFAKRNPL